MPNSRGGGGGVQEGREGGGALHEIRGKARNIQKTEGGGGGYTEYTQGGITRRIKSCVTERTAILYLEKNLQSDMATYLAVFKA